MADVTPMPTRTHARTHRKRRGKRQGDRRPLPHTHTRTHTRSLTHPPTTHTHAYTRKLTGIRRRLLKTSLRAHTHASTQTDRQTPPSNTPTHTHTSALASLRGITTADAPELRSATAWSASPRHETRKRPGNCLKRKKISKTRFGYDSPRSIERGMCDSFSSLHP